MPSVSGARDDIRALLDPASPADALAGHYALHHPANRAEVFVHPASGAPARGFLVRARTGADLFRPLVTLRAPNEAAAQDLFERGLPPNRPVLLVVPEDYAGWATRHLQMTDIALARIYRLDPARFEPIVNVLVVASRYSDGLPRYEIRSGSAGAVAVAGLNWRSPRFAEVYVYVDPAVRGRGFGRSVVSALAADLLRDGLQVLYVVDQTNDASIRTAEGAGFADTGFRQFTGQAVWVA